MRLERKLEGVAAEALRAGGRDRRPGLPGRPGREVVAGEIADRTDQGDRDRRLVADDLIFHQASADDGGASRPVAGVDQRDHWRAADRRFVVDRLWNRLP